MNRCQDPATIAGELHKIVEAVAGVAVNLLALSNDDPEFEAASDAEKLDVLDEAIETLTNYDVATRLFEQLVFLGMAREEARAAKVRPGATPRPLKGKV